MLDVKDTAGSVPEGYDAVGPRGEVAGRDFTAFWLPGGKVVAAMPANDWDAIDSLRALVGREATAAVRDTAISLDEARAAGEG